MAYSARQQQFRRQKQALPPQCQTCSWLFCCHGECPKNRLADGTNYLCAGYRQFFQHVAADMAFMRDELNAGRAPANLMKELKN